MIRICLVGEQLLVRDGIAGLLVPFEDIEIVATAADGPSAWEMVLATRPDVLVLDLNLSDENSLGLLDKLKSVSLLPPTLVLTSFEEDLLLLNAVKAGARGYLLRTAPLDRLVSAIRALAQGGTFLQPAVAERIMHGLRRGSDSSVPASPKYPLTERELEILRLLAGGYNNREIAEVLDIVEGTVKNHVSSILAKLEVRDRTKAVLKALEWGIYSGQRRDIDDGW